MIKFKPVHEIVSTGVPTSILDFKRQPPAISESKICEQLNAKNIALHCDIHKDLDSIISVNAKGENMFSIGSYCCDNFNEKLKMFLEQSGSLA